MARSEAIICAPAGAVVTALTHNTAALAYRMA